MLQLFKNFISVDFITPGHCYPWEPGLGWLNLLSDSWVALSYYAVPLILLYFICQRRDRAVQGMFPLLVAIPIAGVTLHLLEIWTLWQPLHEFSSLFKALTALLSLSTTGLLVFLLSKSLAVPNPVQPEAANPILEPQIPADQQANTQPFNPELEQWVSDRTLALTELNAQLQREIAARQQTEDLLRLTQFSVDRCADAIFWIGADAKLLYVNDAACRSLGYSPAELLSMKVYDINPDFSENAWQLHWKVMRRCGSVNIEVHHRTKHNRIFPVEITINHLTFNGKEYQCAFARDISERKQVEEALRERQEEFQSLVSNIPGAVYRCVGNADRTMIFLSNWIEVLTGYPACDFIQQRVRNFTSLVHPDDAFAVAQAIDQAVSNKQPYIIEYRLLHRDGTIKWVYEKGQAIFSEEGQVLWLNGAIFDITERKQAEVERTALLTSLQESEERLQLALSGTDQGLWDWNLVTGDVYFSAQWHQILGYRNDEIKGRARAWFNLVHPEDRRKMLRLLRQHLAGDTLFVETEHRMLTPSGEWKWVLNHGKIVTRATPGNGDSQKLGKALRITGTLKDISGRKQAEDALRQSEAIASSRAKQLELALLELRETQAQLIQTEKMSSLGQMVAGVAHEINNPVSFIYGNLTYAAQYIKDLLHLIRLYQKHYPKPVLEIKQHMETVELEFLREDLLKILSSMKIGADRIREIVLSLRNFSRLDEAEKKPVDIHEGIDNTLLILQHRLRGKGDYPEIQINKDYGPLPRVECYAGQLNQVFMNLLSNAIDALEERFRMSVQRYDERSRFLPDSGNSAKGPIAAIGTPHRRDGKIREFPSRSLPSSLPPTISIRTEIRGGESIWIRIADNGMGMTEEVRHRLFDPFFTTKPVGKGTGLGLAISYRIVVEKHNGQLRCHSIPGQGSEFVIEIPLGVAVTSSARVEIARQDEGLVI